MIARIWLCKLWKFAACLPVKLAAVYDNAADGRTVSADKFGGRMHNNIRTVLKRAHEVWRRKRTVNDKRQIVGMGDFCHCLNVGNLGVGIAERFYI